MTQSIDTNHEDIVHDAQLDYYGNKLATCSSDKTIKVFDVADDKHVLLAELRGHDGPVWQVAWSHPKFGALLASCSYDRKVFCWKENAEHQWKAVFEYAGHKSSVNSVAWAAHECGLMLACGSSDGCISVHTYDEHSETWRSELIANVHTTGCNAISWAPATRAYGDSAMVQFVSCGSDMRVKIHSRIDSAWNVTQNFEGGHTDIINDVAWAPAVDDGRRDTIASCGRDGRVFIWTCDSQDPVAGPWSKQLLHHYKDSVWHVSWSLMANILAVSVADDKVVLWKFNVKQKKWLPVS